MTTAKRFSGPSRLWIRLALACLSILALPAVGRAGQRLDNTFNALCVGLKYPGTPDKLDFTTKDALDMARAFQKVSGFDLKHYRVETLVDDDPQGDKPTPETIIRRLEVMAKAAGPDDRLVFFFSGHGRKNEQNESMLICSGGEAQDDPKGHLRLSEVRDILGRSRARDKLVLVDACYSGGKATNDGGLSAADVAESMRFSGAKSGADDGSQSAWLVSSSVNEKSWEDGESRNGLFTRYLLEALGPQADIADSNRDSFLSLKELHQYVKNGISAFIYQKAVREKQEKWRGVSQTPTVGMGGNRDPDSPLLDKKNFFFLGSNMESPAEPVRIDPDQVALERLNQAAALLDPMFDQYAVLLPKLA
ncbi:MAG: caspase family protein, partial [Planctomycetota bacterium]|nr:caspase family protein [Planctomycetota bacterium]